MFKILLATCGVMLFTLFAGIVGAGAAEPSRALPSVLNAP